jgi:hypothetical protein
VDAYRIGRPVLQPDLGAPSEAHWPAFTQPAVAGGARAVFGFTMSVGAVRLGALNLYRNRPGPLPTEQHTDAAIVAGVAGRALITMQTGADPGTLGVELEAGSNLRLVVHQATGMVAEQLGITVTEALMRLRAYAFAQDRALTDIANDVDTGPVRFSQTGGDSPVP